MLNGPTTIATPPQRARLVTTAAGPAPLSTKLEKGDGKDGDAAAAIGPNWTSLANLLLFAGTALGGGALSWWLLR